MRCRQAMDLLPAYAEGDLDENLRAEFRSHTRECPDCARALRLETRWRSAVALDEVPPPPPVYFEGVLAGIHRNLPVRVTAPVRRRARFAPAEAASAFMAFLLLAWLGVGFGPELLPDSGSEGLPQSAAGTSPGARRAPSAARIATAAAPGSRVPLVLVQGVGILPGDHEILRLPPAVRSELGLDAAARIFDLGWKS